MKTVIIGAGSGFGRRLSVDILSREPIRESTIALCDINRERLELVGKYVRKVIDHHRLPAALVTSTDRREVLRDADFVVIAVSIGGPAYYGKPYEDEIMIPDKYGVEQTIGDTVTCGAVFRALRTAPALMEMCRDIRELCPDCMILNYTNPMAMLTWILDLWTAGQVAGLCHGVQGTSKSMAEYIGAPYEEMTFKAAGINHLAWFVEFKHNGEDAYPKLRAAMEDPEIYAKDDVRFDILKHFGYFCTESTVHCAEYMPYFREVRHARKRDEEGLKRKQNQRQSWLKDMGIKVEDAESIDLVRTHEYASGIIEAKVTGVPYVFNGNVLNNGLITNLPDGCCVEVPCLVDRNGIQPCVIGDLPAQCAALCRTNVNVQELAVRAILDRDREAAYHALMLDPVTSDVLSLEEGRKLFEEMWEAEGDLLGWYG